jgi:2-polyprenyl-6-methoxyphenol hydroxylase-like FAD-dependent oxidoreductase
MVLALQLNQLGVACMIINKERESRWHPKGNTHNSRTMEHYRRLGLAKEIRSFGLPADHPTDVGYFTTLAGFEVARLRMPSEAEKKQVVETADPADQIMEPIFRCNQMYVERFLFDKVRTAEHIDSRFGWECVEWRDFGDRVEVRAVETATSREEVFEGQYLVGCDGGNSFVRRKLGIRYSGEPAREQLWAGGLTASTFLRAPAFYRKAIRGPLCWQYFVANPRVQANFVALDGKELFLFSTRLVLRENEQESEVIDRRLKLCIGTDAEFEYLGHFSWTAGQGLVADSYGAGRVVLAGDAVHLFTPQGGFGMNTGIDDVANLSWKLAALVRGWGGPNLLRSYAAERRPIAIRNTTAAQKMARRAGVVPIADDIEEATLAGEQARREAGDFYRRSAEAAYASIGIQLGARYDNSPIVIGDGNAPHDDAHQYVPSASPGGRAPHVWLGKNQSIFDEFGAGFTLVCFSSSAHSHAEVSSPTSGRKLPLKTIHIASPIARDLYEADFALVRPDQHVAWRGNQLPSDFDGLIDVVTGGSRETRSTA